MAKNKAFDLDYFDFNKNKPQEFLNNPAKYIENNFRNLFGKEYNKENLINLVSEEWDDYTHPKDFREIKSRMKESGDLDFFYMDLEHRGITEEIALTEGHHNIQKRFIGRSFEDSIKQELAEQNYKVYRGNRTIDVSLQDSMMNLKFDNPEDFNILNNAIEFNNSTYKEWKAYDYNKENKRLIKDAPTFFDHYANNLKKEGGYTEHYISNYLNDIQKKAEEFGYNIDLQGIINERKLQARAEKLFIHEGHAMNREYHVKQDRINQIEEEMKKFKHDSPEYKALELERNNIEVSLRDWKGTHQTLELPPPREGAPMFEGGAVPSVIADNPEYGVNYDIDMNNVQTASSTQSTASETITPEIQEKIKQLTEEARQRFETQQQEEFNQRMEQIKNEYDTEAVRIEKEFGQGTRHTDNTDNVNKQQQPDMEPENSTPNNQTTGSEKYSGRTIDMSDEDWASTTDDDIFEWAENGEELEYATAQREAARERLKTQQQSTQPDTDTNVEPKFATEEDLNPENDPVKKTKSKTAAGGIDESIKIFVDPSSFKTLDQFADLTDNEIQRYLKTLNNVDKQDVYNDLIEKRQQARINRVKNHAGGAKGYIDNILNNQMPFETPNKHHPIYGYTSATEDYKNPKGFSRPELDIEVDEKTGAAILNKTGATHHVGEARPKVQPRLQDGDDIFGWLKKHKLGLGDAINVLFSIGSYNEARREGHGVVSSAARAAGQFVMGELTGFWGGLGLQAAKAVPKIAIKGTELLYKENRKMNSAANSQVFGGAQFQDTQQLATMRQSGMEMAKMAQYNLQQTLMGNEASYLHR